MDDKLKTARREIDEVDRAAAVLFLRRMRAVKVVAEYKKEHGLEIYDPERERDILLRRTAELECEEAGIKELYAAWLQATMDLSKQYQKSLTETDGNKGKCGTNNE